MTWFHKHTYLFAWLFFFILFFANSIVFAEGINKPTTETPITAHYLVATYFYTTVRCPTCKNIEAYSAEAIQNNFSEELKNGSLVWRTVNTDEPENQHYSKDYQLYTKSLIISEVKDGKEVRWKNLEKIWTHIRDRQKFEQYVVSQINDWLKE
jgi:hypothetical protein